MPLEPIVNELLYVPFSNEYEVDPKIKVGLTTDIFFSEDGCFVKPDFKDSIDRIKKISGTEEEAFYPISQKNLITQYESSMNSEIRFKKWIENSGEGMFCLLGDAGTGKTTYLHSLRYEHTEFLWKIVDLRKSVDSISMPGSNVVFSEESFALLHGKVVSALIEGITDYLFPTVEGIAWDFKKSGENIRRLLHCYEKHIAKLAPLEKYDELYKRLKAVPDQKDDESYSRSCAKILAEYLNRTCSSVLSGQESNESFALACALEHYLIYLLTLLYDEAEETQADIENNAGQKRKVIIAFDNIERFIGDDEIFSAEISTFIKHLRGIIDSYGKRYSVRGTAINKFAERFQFIISMRNTTVRNYVPLQNTDFYAHTLDLSNWFPINKIIYKKLEWYQKNSIDTGARDYKDQLFYILNDLGITKSTTIRGLRPKLNMLFDYNKRLIISFLTDMLSKTENEQYLTQAAKFRKMDQSFSKLSADDARKSKLVRFAYRSIIWRLILNHLRAGSLFSSTSKAGAEQKDSETDSSKTERSKIEINYIWHFLAILYDYSTNLTDNEMDSLQAQYMPFHNFMEKFKPEYGSYENWRTIDSMKQERERIARLLYHMNYYNRRNNHWFQFIDIEYSEAGQDKVRIESWGGLLSLMTGEKNKCLKIRITESGKAYLGYIGYLFEFFSCLHNETKPLLCCIPDSAVSVSDYRELACYKLIRAILDEMSDYIRDSLKKDAPSIALSSNNDPIPYFVRVTNHVYGYLNSFSDCLDLFWEPEDIISQEQKEKLIEYVKGAAREVTSKAEKTKKLRGQARLDVWDRKKVKKRTGSKRGR